MTRFALTLLCVAGLIASIARADDKEELAGAGPQIMSVQLGYRAYVEAPTNGPSWGLRAAIVLLFPK